MTYLTSEQRYRKFLDDVIRYGWIQILGKLTPISKEVLDSYRPGKRSKRGDCPYLEHKQGHSKTFVLLPSAESDGASYCYKCGHKMSGFDLVGECNGLSNFRDIRKLIEDLIYGGMRPEEVKFKPRKVVDTTVVSEEDKKKSKGRINSCNELWNSSLSIHSPEAKVFRDYLASRAIHELGSIGKNVRFHPHVKFTEEVESSIGMEDNPDKLARREAKLKFLRDHPFYQGERKSIDDTIYVNMGYHPCGLFLLRDNSTGQATCIQRIYLSPEGTKMELHGHHDISVKKITARIFTISRTSDSCHLDPPSSPFIGVAEGPETSLCVRGSLNLPFNCCIDAGKLGNWEPITVETPNGRQIVNDVVLIFEDKDKSGAGHAAAKKLHERLKEKGLKSIILTPPLELHEGEKSVDWLDAISQLGMEAFPDWLIHWDKTLYGFLESNLEYSEYFKRFTKHNF